MDEKKLNKLADELAGEVRTQKDIEAVSQTLMKRFLESALGAEMEDHLGYAKHDAKGRNKGNSRNGHTPKTVKGSHGEVEVRTPRDRDGTFEPAIVAKRQTRLEGLDDQILALYGRGMTTRDIVDFLDDMYGAKVSATLVSRVTQAVVDDMEAWQSRPLDAVYPIAWMDCIRIKIRQDRRVLDKAVYLIVGLNVHGHKELLGLWLSQTEGASFWTGVLSELRNRGVEDIFIACVDGLTGFPQAIEATFPRTKVQLCVVHMIRNSLRYVPWKARKAVAADLRAIYSSPTLHQAERELEAFADKWDDDYPPISKQWQRHWSELITMFDYPPEIRRVIYTTNIVESVNSVIRKAINNRRMFPHDDAAMKVVYLAIDRASKKWTRPIHNWKSAMMRFAIDFPDRMPVE